MRDAVNDFFDMLMWFGMCTMLLGFVFLCAWMYPPLHEAKKMDCALAEFSPDIAADVKKACREARSK